MSEAIPNTGYHLIKDDVQDALATLRAQVTHTSDGSPLGEKCWGFFLGELYVHSKRWHAVRERQDVVAALDGRVTALRVTIGSALSILQEPNHEKRDVPRAILCLLEALRDSQ